MSPNFWIDENTVNNDIDSILSREKTKTKMKSRIKAIDSPPPELVTEHKEDCVCSYCDTSNGTWELPREGVIDLNKDSAWQITAARDAIVKHNPYTPCGTPKSSNPKSNYEFKERTPAEEKAMFEKYQRQDKVRSTIGHIDVDYKSADSALAKWTKILEKEEKEKKDDILEGEIAARLEEERLKQVPVKAIVCFYVNVGMIPSDKVEAALQKYKDRLNVDRWPETYERFWIPVHGEPTRVEVLPLGIA